MNVEIKVPPLGESISEATILKWHKKPGEAVKADELLVELETDKVTIEINSPAAGAIASISANEGDVVQIGQIVGQVQQGAVATAAVASNDSKPVAATPAPAKAPEIHIVKADDRLSPAARKIAVENNLSTSNMPGTGKDGRITKSDAMEAASGRSAVSINEAMVVMPDNDVREERVKMTRLRKTIAERLKASQNTAAILSTFNEIDMTNVIALRNSYKDAFQKKHGVKLGFMSFFVKAALIALKEIPSVNAEIDGNYIVYKNHYDIGVAVGTEQGLVVPVLRDADTLSLAGIEKAIAGLGEKARQGKLSMQDLSGGTFTISNGGVYGSLLSTPIINPPQSGILGMHKTQERPVAVNGKVEIHPMMYIALSYDHRIIDGKEAVTFLVRIKESIENPERLILDL